MYSILSAQSNIQTYKRVNTLGEDKHQCFIIFKTVFVSLFKKKSCRNVYYTRSFIINQEPHSSPVTLRF